MSQARVRRGSDSFWGTSLSAVSLWDQTLVAFRADSSGKGIGQVPHPQKGAAEGRASGQAEPPAGSPTRSWGLRRTSPGAAFSARLGGRTCGPGLHAEVLPADTHSHVAVPPAVRPAARPLVKNSQKPCRPSHTASRPRGTGRPVHSGRAFSGLASHRVAAPAVT